MTETLEPALPADVEQRAHRMLERACEADLSLATAESCTGGLLAALLTDVPGCSHVFERGFVAYSRQAKCDLLDIERAHVDSCGAVSQPIAIAMARGAIARSTADIALAITGYAGPPDQEGDEEGLVHFACARKNGAVTHREEHFGPIGRGAMRIAALAVALDMIEEALQA